MLENRPECPIDFMAEYFRNAKEGSTPLQRSYRYIRLTRHNREAFMGNLLSAYRSMHANRTRGLVAGAGITKESYVRLLKLVCIDFPVDVIDAVFKVIDSRSSTMSFRTFCCGIYTCLVYEDFFERVEWLFKTLTDEAGDSKVAGSGVGGEKESAGTDEKVSGSALLNVIEAIRSQPGADSMQVPSPEIVSSCLAKLGIDESNAGSKFLSFQQFVRAMFQVCMPVEIFRKHEATPGFDEEKSAAADDKNSTVD